ncbi:MAG: metallophosphoesterase [candidate division NC10 bacterium]|nr:metallophosphoesterase [candidate division NC10 bacterium]
MPLSFVHASDFHLTAERGALQHGVDTGACLARAVPLLNALRPTVIVAGGDLASDGSEAAYRRLQALWGPLTAPIHFLLGNHDDAAAFRRVFRPGEAADAPLTGGVTLDGVRFLLLNSAVAGQEGGRIGEEALHWLEKDLAENATAPTWLFLHHQPLPIRQRWLDRIGLADSVPFLEVVSRHPQVAGVCYGHVHQSRRWRYGRSLFLGVPALAFQFAPVGQEAPIITPDAPAFRRVEIRPDGPRTWLHFLDGRVREEPSLEATPVYVR